MKAENVDCLMCDGSGVFQMACCNGFGGCSCGGGFVPVLCECQTGISPGDMYSGFAFIGSGPSIGYFSESPAANVLSNFLTDKQPNAKEER